MLLVYLHGFNSDGHGPKYYALRNHFRTFDVLSPDLPADPEGVIALLDSLHQQTQEPVYLIGTSLGAFYAYYYHSISGYPVFLFNPSLRPHETLARRTGEYQTYSKRRNYSFTSEYLTTLEQMTQRADANHRPELLHFFLAKDDELLDLEDIPERFGKASFLNWYSKAGHKFSRFEEVVPELASLIESAAGDFHHHLE